MFVFRFCAARLSLGVPLQPSRGPRRFRARSSQLQAEWRSGLRVGPRVKGPWTEATPRWFARSLRGQIPRWLVCWREGRARRTNDKSVVARGSSVCLRRLDTSMYKETHATHARAHVHAHERKHTCVRMRTHAYARMHARPHAHAYARTHTQPKPKSISRFRG